MKKFYLLIYSKFSSHCKEFIELITALPNINLNFLCIDNPKTRNRILQDKHLNITKVPTLLIVSEIAGVLQKFEGNQAFIYLKTVLTPLPTSVQTPSTPPIKEEIEHKEEQNHTIIDHENHTSIQINDFIDDDEEETTKNFVHENTENTKKDDKKVSLIAQATAMQKLRLQEDELMKKTR